MPQTKQNIFIKIIEMEEARISKDHFGIIHVHLNDNTVLDVELQNRMLVNYIEITGGKLSPFIFTAGKDVVVTKEARDNAIAMEELSPCKTMAVVVTNLAYKLISNFYLHFNKPKRPYKVFDDKAAAIKWLKLSLD